MDKKQGLINILQVIKDKSPKAQLFLDALEQDKMTPEMIDKLTKILKTIISTIKDSQTKDKFQEMITYLDTLKQKEKEDREKESVELENLEHMIEEV